MSVSKDTTATIERARGYAREMKSLLSRHAVHSIEDLKRLGREPSFKSEITAFWKAIPEAEGAKIALTVVLSTIAIAMGGVGIAAGGGAIGLPLLAILAPVGYFTGQELDSEGYTKTVLGMFQKLLQLAQKLDFERYAGSVEDEAKSIFETIHNLDTQRCREVVVDKIENLLRKAKGHS
jgi:hypothetical protein